MWPTGLPIPEFRQIGPVSQTNQSPSVDPTSGWALNPSSTAIAIAVEARIPPYFALAGRASRIAKGWL
jgi:hypothetical protein